MTLQNRSVFTSSKNLIRSGLPLGLILLLLFPGYGIGAQRPAPAPQEASSPLLTTEASPARNLLGRLWHSEGRKPLVKAAWYTLAFAVGIALLWGFAGLAFVLAFNGAIGGLASLGLVVLGTLAADWLASGVFNRLAGISTAKGKWVSRLLHLPLLFGLGLLVGYIWGIWLSFGAIVLIAAIAALFWGISAAIFRHFADRPVSQEE